MILYRCRGESVNTYHLNLFCTGVAARCFEVVLFRCQRCRQSTMSTRSMHYVLQQQREAAAPAATAVLVVVATATAVAAGAVQAVISTAATVDSSGRGCGNAIIRNSDSSYNIMMREILLT